MVKLATLEEVRAGGVFKYVRMADDSFRLAEVTPWLEHRQMATREECPKSAGSVAVRHGSLKTIFHGSGTLGLPSLPDDEELMHKLVFGDA